MFLNCKKAILLIPFLLLGCVSTKNNTQTKKLTSYEQAILKESIRTDEILSKAALLVSKSLAVYVRTNQAKTQPLLSHDQIRQAVAQELYIPSGMEVKMSFSWDSAPEPLLSALSSSSGYQLFYKNQRPPISKSVTVDATKRTIKSFIDIIEQQTKGYIKDIALIEKDGYRVIIVTYSDF